MSADTPTSGVASQDTAPSGGGMSEPTSASIGHPAQPEVVTYCDDRDIPEDGTNAPCSGATPTCLHGTCVECLPDRLGCGWGQTPVKCDANGHWQSAGPACAGDTATCSDGACVACVPGTSNPPACKIICGYIQVCMGGWFCDADGVLHVLN